MKIVKSFVKLNATCIKDGKEIDAGLTHEIVWENDFNNQKALQFLNEILYEIEKQGYIIKEGTTPSVIISDIPAKFDKSIETTTGDKALDDFLGIEVKPEIEPESQPVKKSKFRL